MRATRLLCSLVAATALVLTTSPLARAGVPAGDPTYAAPTIGECRDLTMRELAQDADDEAPISCDSPHTARTIAVLTVPATVDWTDHDALLRIAEKGCAPAQSSILGGSAVHQAMSAYEWGWFVPTEAQQSSGALWIRCDTILMGGRRLLPLPTDATPVLPRGNFSDGIARCLLADTTTITLTACSGKHGWRAEGGFVLKQKAYPDNRKGYHTLLKRCGRIVGGHVYYRWTFPGKVAWRAGARAAVCYAQTRH